jgi:hypothetical protein
MSERTAALARMDVRWRCAALAALLSLLFGAALWQGLAHLDSSSAGVPSARHARPRATLLSLPLAAAGPVSGTLGAADPAYRASAAQGGLQTVSPAQRLRGRFSSSGVLLSTGAARLGLSVRGLGYGIAVTPVAAVSPRAAGNRVTYAHPGLTEWYRNGPLGLEQGFTVPRPAVGQWAAGALTLAMALSGDLHASLIQGGGRLLLARSGHTVLSYGGLAASDARGRALRSWLELRAGELLLRVDARGASYPLRIDPLIQSGDTLTGGQEELELRGEVNVAHGALGYSVALSADGNTAVVGAPNDGDFAGAVWVFARWGGRWAQQGPKLTAPEGSGEGGGSPCDETAGEEAEECAFGRSVALSADGSTVLIGGPRSTGPCQRTGPPKECRNHGAAWLYARAGSGWSLVGTLTGGPEEGAEGRFGRSVALSADGSTAAVGGPSDLGGLGTAWVFTRSGSTWSQQGPMLTGGGEEAGAGHFGGSVALSGDGNTVLVGAPGDGGYKGAAWLFARSGSSWTQQGAKLTGSNDEEGEGQFGYCVALSADATTALIGGRGDAGRGAAWVFTPSGGTWVQQGPKLTGGAEVGGEAPRFGSSVALTANGNVALIGAPYDSSAVGAAWLFARSKGSWTQQGSKLTSGAEPASKVRKGRFGSSVALRSDGLTALIGAPTEDSSAGAAWVFSDPSILPLVEDVTPASGSTAGGTALKIVGKRLAGASAVEFTSSAAGGSAVPVSFSVDSPESVAVVSPPGRSETVCVTVTTPEGVSPCAHFSYVPPPTVKALLPDSGPTAGGTSVTIIGTALAAASAVRFGSVNAASFTVNSAESITAVTPAEPEGDPVVTVTTPYGTSPARGARFTFTSPVGSGSTLTPDAGSGSTLTPDAGSGSTGVLAYGPVGSGCAAALVSRSVTVRRHTRAAVRLRWSGAGTCHGKLTLRVKVKVRTSSSARLATRAKIIGTAYFALAPGKARTVSVKVNALGRSLLTAGRGRLRASLAIFGLTPRRSPSRITSVLLRM